jgi:hypothetical protein
VLPFADCIDAESVSDGTAVNMAFVSRLENELPYRMGAPFSEFSTYDACRDASEILANGFFGPAVRSE